MTAAAAASREPPQRPRVHKPDTRDSDGHTCPVHWFVADDTVTKIRHFSLQARPPPTHLRFAARQRACR